MADQQPPAKVRRLESGLPGPTYRPALFTNLRLAASSNSQEISTATSRNPVKVVTSATGLLGISPQRRKLGPTNLEPSSSPLATVSVPRTSVGISTITAAPSPSSENALLPIFRYADKILRAIEENDVVILAGDTGCGKTSGVPHILLKQAATKRGPFNKISSELPQIVITQPRRVAATSVAARVASETAKDAKLVRALLDRQKQATSRASTQTATGASHRLRRWNFALGGLVGYRVRFDEKFTPGMTKICFVTDGLLIRESLMTTPNTKRGCDQAIVDKVAASAEVAASPLLKYDYLIVDEAHERSLRIDELLGLCRVALAAQKKQAAGKNPKSKLKVIIMSATLDTHTLLDFFRAEASLRVGMIAVEGKMFPVQTFYTFSPVKDIIQGCLDAVTQIMLEPNSEGDVLVFLPGTDEIISLMRAVRGKIQLLAEHKAVTLALIRLANGLTDPEGQARHHLLKCLRSGHHAVTKFAKFLSEFFAIESTLISAPAQEILLKHLKGIAANNAWDRLQVQVAMQEGDDEPEVPEQKQVQAINTTQKPADFTSTTSALAHLPKWMRNEWQVFPLYASLSMTEQQKIFAPPPTLDHRKIIIATNVAETSVTLPFVRYVIDSGKVKLKFGNSLKVVEESRAMADQRKGRAGRVSSGTCYRLMPSAVFDKLKLQVPPEILRCELAELLLELKAMDEWGNRALMKQLVGPGNFDASKCFELRYFPLPSPPTSQNILEARAFLKRLAAVEGQSENLTKKGSLLARLPLPVLYGNMLLSSFEFGCVAEMIIILAMLSLDVLWFSHDHLNERESTHRACEGARTTAINDHGDSSAASSKAATVRKRILHPHSDHLGLLNLYQAWRRAADPPGFARLMEVEHRNLVRAKQICDQLESLIIDDYENFGLKKLPPVMMHTAHDCGGRQGKVSSQDKDPTRRQATVRIPAALNFAQDHTQSQAGYNTIRQCIAHGLSLNLAVLVMDDSATNGGATGAAAKYQTELRRSSGFVAITPTSEDTPANSKKMLSADQQQLAIHPTSSFYLFKAQRPRYIVFSSIMETSIVFAREVTAVDPDVAVQLISQIRGGVDN